MSTQLLGAYNEGQERPPFLEVGSYELELIDAKKSVTFVDKTPYWGVDIKVTKSTNPAHPAGTKAAIMVKAKGFSYANTVYNLFSAITGVPPQKLSEAAIDLFLGQLKSKIVGRKFSAVLTVKTAQKKVNKVPQFDAEGKPVMSSWLEYMFGSLDAAPVS